MSTDIEPVAGTWYQRLGQDGTFVVNDVDAKGGVVELQHYDGQIEEMDLKEWYSLELEVVAPPEDWRGPVDVDSADLDDGESAAARPPALGDVEWPEED